MGQLLVNQAVKAINEGRLIDAKNSLSAIESGSPYAATAALLTGLIAAMTGNASHGVASMAQAVRTGAPPMDGVLLMASILERISDIKTLRSGVGELFSLLADMLERSDINVLVFQSLGKLKFRKDQSVERNEVYASQFVLPMIRVCYGRGIYDLAMGLESLYYEAYVKQVETEAHFQRSFSLFQDVAIQSGEALASRLESHALARDESPWRIGFFIHNASVLAHIELLINMLKGVRSMPDLPFQPVIFCFGGDSPEMSRIFTELGVEVVHLDREVGNKNSSYLKRFLIMRRMIEERGIHALVWISLGVLMPFAFGLRIAPVQIWWSMKYHSLKFSAMDDRITDWGITRWHDVVGEKWRNGVIGVDNWRDDSLIDEAVSIREKYKDKIVLATYGREEKLSDWYFLEMVSELLRRYPQTVFLWTGKCQPGIVNEIFERNGVLERTHFIGWVNTRLYAHVHDIFIDSYPFPCGFTAFQSMAAGKPLVVHACRESEESGLYAFLGSVLCGRDGDEADRKGLVRLLGEGSDQKIPICQWPSEMLDHIGRMIEDGYWREACGVTAKQVMGHYFANPLLMGLSHSAHFLDMISSRFPAAAKDAQRLFAQWDRLRDGRDPDLVAQE